MCTRVQEPWESEEGLRSSVPGVIGGYELPNGAHQTQVLWKSNKSGLNNWAFSPAPRPNIFNTKKQAFVAESLIKVTILVHLIQDSLQYRHCSAPFTTLKELRQCAQSPAKNLKH